MGGKILASTALVSLLVVGVVAAQADDAGGEDTSRESRQRLQLMQAAIADFTVTSPELADLKFAAKPVLRYSDPTRGLSGETSLLDASVWRLGKQGRPTALVTLEIYRGPNRANTLSYEFLSLAKEPFSLTNDKRIGWEATGTDLQMKVLPDAPRPADSEAGRLRQMRDLARRFRAVETLHGEKIDCRLMTQPIDRYADSAEGLTDGAAFVFANATNPEGGLLLECDETSWRYGAFRLSSAALTIELDDAVVATFPFFGQYGKRDGPYTSASHPLKPIGRDP